MHPYSEVTKKGENKKRKEHIPHSKRPNEYVVKRNRRERERVDNVNQAFVNLRDHLPFRKNDNRMSKISILKSASEYIQSLSGVIRTHDLIKSEKSTPHLQNRLLLDDYNLKTATLSSYQAHPLEDYKMNTNITCENQPHEVQELMVLTWIHNQLLNI
ncbi:hypothetical protein LOTGIDRAFT_167740 [Lottia gigantea]|uniref:BHLH domain-containing protein n=1 Tax=Lottia gigantea TaxID=225164 RepID=V4B9U2_LOTGI|nr:hypothetical protein LOTGIDRAFT_167740 [Lottia gigantea]ESO85769.1 hypothetical protein LOTGIDRAFT_167740 [Lottia gigantea]